MRSLTESEDGLNKWLDTLSWLATHEVSVNGLSVCRFEFLETDCNYSLEVTLGFIYCKLHSLILSDNHGFSNIVWSFAVVDPLLWKHSTQTSVMVQIDNSFTVLCWVVLQNFLFNLSPSELMKEAIVFGMCVCVWLNAYLHNNWTKTTEQKVIWFGRVSGMVHD